MTEREYLVVLYSYIPFGPARMKLLIEYFGSAKKAWRATEKKLLEIGLKNDRAKDFVEYRESFDLTSYFARLKKLKIDFITINDKKYPENLVDLAHAPPVLYIKGSVSPNDSNAVSIVGTRKMTSYGREVTEQFASQLASLGITIVSGMARGIDTTAHKAALSAGGRTIAVLACGLDQVYPVENTQLARKIIDGHGAILSEYPLEYPALRNNFPSRNRIISGLSKAVLVVEGAQKSGTLLTASAAAEQGRQVFSVPGQITSPMSAAPHFLIKSGAKIAFSPEDILNELDLQLKVDKEAVQKVLPTSKEEGILAEILEVEPLHLDQIAAISGLQVADISARLTIMELKGLVKRLGGGVYKKA
ncbi:DNA-protecting protein DprA [Patescibacteria group bacterium]|nr:DNA-protecting protein DprA [Patescibacteria group bacterium]